MNERMEPIPFNPLLTWMLAGYRRDQTIFGSPVYRPDAIQGTAGAGWPLGGRQLGSPIGPAAGPHTQLAQNIIAAYAAGARFFELKTVQVIDGQDLPVAKPCIAVPNEGYNVEWSTELTVAQAFAEYIKAWLAIHVLARELDLGSPLDFAFNMSVGYDLAGIQSPKINAFIDGLRDASQTAVWQACCRDLHELAGDPTEAGLLHRLTAADIGQISPQVCTAITLSTLHGCPPAEIERIAVYLLTEKRLDTAVKYNPTLLGYAVVRATLDRLGFAGIQFDDHHFRSDLQFAEAVALTRRLQAAAASQGLDFSIKLSNTLPVEIRHQELPGSEMYLSGRALYPLTIQLAAKLAEALAGEVRISFCGGADAFNLADICQAGVWPVTVATTLLKPGGLARLSQLAELAAAVRPGRIDVGALRRLADHAAMLPAYGYPALPPRQPLPPASRKLARKVPWFDCYVAPCQESCPFGQDAPAYISRMAEGHTLEALRIITARNPLPLTTGLFCDHRCMTHCRRLDYETAVDIRGIKRAAARQALAALVAETRPPVFTHPARIACLDGSPAALAAAWALCRNGLATTIFAAADQIGSLGGVVSAAFREAVEQDCALLRQGGVQFQTEPASLAGLSPECLKAQGFAYVFSASDADLSGHSLARSIAAGLRFAGEVCRQVTGQALDLPPGQAGSQPAEPAVAGDRARRQTRALARKGRLQQPGHQTPESERCLDCQVLCNVCVDVCPNRANIALRMDSPQVRDTGQVIHLDGPCNACGNCATFCPYDSAPYRDKLTLFWTPEAMAASSSDGFCLIDRPSRQFAVRLAAVTRQWQLPAGEEEAAASPDSLPAALADLIRTVVRDYPWLLIEVEP